LINRDATNVHPANSIDWSSTVAQTATFSGLMLNTNATDASNLTTASVVLSGGLAVTKQLRVGGASTFSENVTIATGKSLTVDTITATAASVTVNKPLAIGITGTAGTLNLNRSSDGANVARIVLDGNLLDVRAGGGSSATLLSGTSHVAFGVNSGLATAFVETARVTSAGLAIGATALVGSERLRIAGDTAAAPGTTDVTVGAGELRAGTKVRCRRFSGPGTQITLTDVNVWYDIPDSDDVSGVCVIRQASSGGAAAILCDPSVAPSVIADTLVDGPYEFQRSGVKLQMRRTGGSARNMRFAFINANES
jgi:hypothetical protein